jgi:signal transduction histidine kinase
VALGLWAVGGSVVTVQPVMAGTCALANLASAGAVFARCRTAQRDRLGWQMLGWALAAGTVTNVLMALRPAHPSLPGGWVAGLSLLGLGLNAGALLAWPWRSRSPALRSLNLLGSALFVGSFLVFLWSLGVWEAGLQSRQSPNLALTVTAARFCVLGGITLYLLAENPARARGVLGFTLANVLAGGIYLVLLQTLVRLGTLAVLPWVGIAALAPLLLGLAAWSGAPVEVPDSDEGPPQAPLWELLPYAPFLLAGITILVQVAQGQTRWAGPVLGFLALTAVLVLRQFLLLKELRQSNQRLEERVRVRTSDLEALQTTLIRTERMNAVVSIGAGLTHDLNNHLGVVIASAELLKAEQCQACLPPSPHLERITLVAGKAALLTRRLMGFGRKEDGPPQIVDLGEELERIQDLLRLLLPRNVHLRLELVPGPVQVSTRRSHLEQALVNLVSNARDAMPQGGEILIRLETGSGANGLLGRILVADTGPGLNPQAMEHLFEPFFTTKAFGALQDRHRPALQNQATGISFGS